MFQNLSKFFIFSLFILSFISIGATATEWVEIQNFEGYVQNNQNAPTNFTQVQYFNGQMNYEAEEIFIPSSIDLVSAMIWLMIIWIPSLLLNYLFPGYGMISGLVLMTCLMAFMFNDFMIVTFITFVTGAILFWRGI